MTTVAITGGIACGKSTTARILSDGGFRLVDTDLIAREVVRPGGPCLERIAGRFGPDVLLPEGGLDRGRLAARVFADPDARRDLEAIVHPVIHARWRGLLEVWRDSGCRVGFVVIPLLYEKGYEASFDAVVALHCSESTQRERLAGRGWAPGEIDGRLASQWTSGAKADRADHVVWTEGSLRAHEGQWGRILAARGWISGCRA